MSKIFLIVLLSTSFCANALDNGLALTPPMGWLSWQRFRCVTDCVNYPDDCINEKLFRDMADRMSEDGYLQSGYEYLIIDDCWLATERDAEGRLQPDAERFPNGIKAVADYVHSKGLKFGIYEDIGTNTCGGYPGIDGQWEIDANTFAEWDVDYIKVDGCYAELEGLEEKYAEFGAALNQTGRPMVYSCSFTAYKELEANYTAAVELCNLWRNYGDIQDSWADVKDIAMWFGTNQGFINRFAGPGHWNDPDMLIIGNYGLSYDQSVAQMVIWSVMGAPLIMSVDLRTIEPEFAAILRNEVAIRINQDELGIPGLLAWQNSDVYIWTKPTNPQFEGRYSYAFAIASFRNGGGPFQIEITLEQLGLDNPNGYAVTNIFDPSVEPFVVGISDPVRISVNPSGGVLLQIIPVGVKEFEF